MTRLRRNLALLLASALAIAGAGTAYAVQRGPAGRAFYKPPRHLPGSRPGDVIRWRPLTTGARLPSAARNILVLYRSTALNGRAIAVSGTIAIPKGKPPKHGWPVISWAHGTSGFGDACAPSLDGPGHHATGDIPYTNTLLDQWVRAGYVVLRTDYEGLGTPGPHPFLVGHSEARGVIDIVRAARQLDPKVGRRWIAAGHSQGGEGALFAAADAQRRAPELQLRGVVAFAPLGDASGLVRVLASVSVPLPQSAYGGLLVAGINGVAPQKHLPRKLTSKARAHYADLSRLCLDQLEAPSSWGGLAPSELIKPGGVTLLEHLLNRYAEAGGLKIRVPVRIEQGDSDQTAPKPFTDKLVAQLRARRAHVTYNVFADATHHGVLAAGWADATAFAAARLR